MKKTIATVSLLALLISNTLTAQVAINTDGSTADASAILDLQSTDKGFLLPRMTITQRDAISNSDNGLMIFNTGTKRPNYYSGSQWVTHDSTWENCGTITYSGQVYNTVMIGDQCWMAENLNVGTRIDGTNNQINNGAIEKYCFDDNDANCTTYGGLYQWDEIMQYVTTEGVQGICPSGWHIPTDAEWTTLTNCAGGLSTAAGKLKETGNAHWLTPNTGAINECGLTNLPAGYYNNDGNFHYQMSISYSWSSTAQTTDNAWGRRMHYQSAEVNNWAFSKQWGLSVRCIQD